MCGCETFAACDIGGGARHEDHRGSLHIPQTRKLSAMHDYPCHRWRGDAEEEEERPEHTTSPPWIMTNDNEDKSPRELAEPGFERGNTPPRASVAGRTRLLKNEIELDDRR